MRIECVGDRRDVVLQICALHVRFGARFSVLSTYKGDVGPETYMAHKRPPGYV